MTLTIELTPEQEAELRERAVAGVDASENPKDRIKQILPLPPMPPAQAVEYRTREGVTGSDDDPTIDCEELARRMRETVWAGLQDILQRGEE